GGSGIGAAISRRYAEAGAHVIIADRDIAAAERIAAAVSADTGASVDAVELDILDSTGLRTLAEKTAQEGGLDIWVNNAGIYPPTGNVLEATDEHLAQVLDVNVLGTYHAARESARVMRPGSVIINLA